MSAVNSNYMMRLGDFEFAVTAASFEKINYVSSYRWIPKDAPTEKATPIMQYNGPGERSMTIEGTIFPQIVKNGLMQVDKMREQAAKGEAFELCYVESAKGNGAVGRILGRWCITNIAEQRTLFMADGSPREIHFTMELKSFEDKRSYRSN